MSTAIGKIKEHKKKQLHFIHKLHIWYQKRLVNTNITKMATLLVFQYYKLYLSGWIGNKIEFQVFHYHKDVSFNTTVIWQVRLLVRWALPQSWGLIFFPSRTLIDLSFTNYQTCFVQTHVVTSICHCRLNQFKNRIRHEFSARVS